MSPGSGRPMPSSQPSGASSSQATMMERRNFPIVERHKSSKRMKITLPPFAFLRNLQFTNQSLSSLSPMYCYYKRKKISNSK
ncbi:hypothetical protein T01_11704 [Trichinella spiralis]|uniref:Uncharacterized protein n=1 Tax=Trichinella spiralis TaxID=6334 RepID=A0A0V1BPC5_TRISP|nr:hypothetical protein T01_11704 [Trichinella spiralis]